MISVCLATYNGEKFIRDQVESILNQLDVDDELIVSDDGSTDSTVEILKSYPDNRIKIYYNKNNHGVNGNFENAINHSNGDYIYLSDQDDIWLDGKIDACQAALQNYHCIIHDAIVVDQDLKPIYDSFFEERHSGPGFWKNIYRNSYLGCCMAFRREILQLVLPIPYKSTYYHDNWIGSLSDVVYGVKFISFKGILFRRHSNNTSFTAKNSGYSFLKQLINRLSQIIDVIHRLFTLIIRNPKD